MNINATIFVQAINFFIAYLLFRFIFLKPVYSEIQQEKEYLASLTSSVQKNEQGLLEKKNENLKQWNGMRAYFVRYKPEIIDRRSIFYESLPQISIRTLSEEEQKELVETISHDLAKRMKARL